MRWVLVSALAALVFASGCFGGGAPAAPKDEGKSNQPRGLSYELLESFTLDFPPGANDAQPKPRSLTFNSSAVKGRITVTITTKGPGLFVSGNLDIAGALGWDSLTVYARQGADTKAEVEAGNTVSCCNTAGLELASETRTFLVNATRPLTVGLKGWGEVRATVMVEEGVPSVESDEEEEE